MAGVAPRIRLPVKVVEMGAHDLHVWWMSL
jgi:hypothetical protein